MDWLPMLQMASDIIAIILRAIRGDVDTDTAKLAAKDLGERLAEMLGGLPAKEAAEQAAIDAA